MTDSRRGMRVVDEAWISEPVAQNVDSVASWITTEGKVLVYATAKDGNAIRVHDGDTGEFLRAIGMAGTGVGELGRPNGIFIVDDRAFVVENVNHRLQVFDLSTNQSLGTFGDDVLRKPYGLWIHRRAPGGYRLYVTDSYYTPDDRVPPDAELGERVKFFDVNVVDGAVSGRYAGAFGSTEGAGVLRTVESIWGDPEHGRLLVADEDAERRDIKVYDMEGRFLQTLGTGLFRYEPEGITLVVCGNSNGYWVVSDQHASSQVFRVFDRVTLDHVGDFAPHVTHTVDGIWFQRGSHGRFPQGALFSQHADAAVAAFDWTDIASALALREDCGR